MPTRWPAPSGRRSSADGVNGFEMASLEGGFVTEHIMRWEGLPDGRFYTSAGTVPE